jgi:hypothetical protein
MVYPEFWAYYIILIYTHDGELMKYRGLSWQLGADEVMGCHCRSLVFTTGVDEGNCLTLCE